VDKNSTAYTVTFAAIVCLICGVAVAASAVGLREKQETNKLIDKKSKVLAAAGLLPEGKVAQRTIDEIFKNNVVPKAVKLSTGEEAKAVDPTAFDIQKAMRDPATSGAAPENAAKVARLPEHSLVYEIKKDGKLETLVIPVEGKGLWSTLYGFLALSADTETIKGLIFYQHGETPGLGGEVDNPRWRSLWEGRKPFNEDFEPVIEVIKGSAGSVEDAPHQVDGLSGATITGRGVSHLIQFWLGEHGFGPTLTRYRTVHGKNTAEALEPPVRGTNHHGKN
jgi:Na+-transporting NADH:ubiquinone oxidoreductase subunit C